MMGGESSRRAPTGVILIIGMARSGTTVVSHLLGSLPTVHLEIEPHALWKAGHFSHLADNDHDIDGRTIEWIRRKMLSAAGDRVLVEKSPPNCLRPALVNAVFPEARIVYVERDPVRCIHSNLVRSLNKDSLRLSIALKKYFLFTGKRELSGSLGTRRLHRQLRLRDLPFFVGYVGRMVYMRNVMNVLPFGPKLQGFTRTVREEGLCGYHVAVWREAQRCKATFQRLYGVRLGTFHLERLLADTSEVDRLYEFCGLSVSERERDGIIAQLDQHRIRRATQKGKYDAAISRMLLSAEVVSHGRSEARSLAITARGARGTGARRP